MKKTSDFRNKLISAMEDAINNLPNIIKNENLYAISLFTSGEDDFQYILISANTEEGLIEKRNEYAEEFPDYKRKAGLKKLRWSVPDWKYHNYSNRFESIKINDETNARKDSDLYKDFIYCIKFIKKNKYFQNNKNIVLLLTCGDMSEEFFLKGLKALNSSDIVKEYIENYTAVPFLNEIKSLPASARIDKLLALYHDLNLDINSEIALEAKSRNIDSYDLEPVIKSIDDPKVVSKLLQYIKKYGFENAFYKKDSANYKKYGAFTLENRLATSSVFLISECESVNKGHLKLMHKILMKRAKLDKKLEITSPLAENIARVLHEFIPGKIATPKLNPKTNHLDNYEDYITLKI